VPAPAGGVGVRVTSGDGDAAGLALGADVAGGLGVAAAVGDAGRAVGVGFDSPLPHATAIRTAVARVRANPPANHLPLLIAYLH
jgi:hypothetical protein